MNNPEVGEYFVSQTDTVCEMIDDANYIDHNHPNLLMLSYVRGSAFSKKRDATEQERHDKFITKTKVKEMNTEFFIELSDKHDTNQGLKQLEAAYIEHVYKLSKYNQSRAAMMLAISRGCLRMKLKEYFGDTYL